MRTHTPSLFSNIKSKYLLVLLLGIHLALGIASLTQTSVTMDEFLDVPIGLITFKQGSGHAMDIQNPPAFRALTSSPLVWVDPSLRKPDPAYQISAWGYGYDFMIDNYGRYLSLFYLPRLMVMLVSLGLGLAAYYEAKRRWGDFAGLGALTLYALCPNILAHSRLATLDLGLAFGFFFSVSLCAHMRRSTGMWLPLFLGLLLGLTQITKFTGLLLYPLLVLILLPSIEGDISRASRLLKLLFAIGISILVIDAAYGFHDIGLSLSEYQFKSEIFRRLAGFLPDSLPLPLAGMYIRGIDLQLSDGAGYIYFLRDEISVQGWWYYFWVAAAVKLTIPAIVLSLAGICLCIYRRDWDSILHLLLPAMAVFWLFSFLGHKNIGFRYILPALPFLYVLAGSLVTIRSTRPARHAVSRLLVPATVGGMLLFHVYEAFLVNPYPISYFNQLGGGSRGGLHWLGDSNLDWGQDLPALARFLQERGNPEIQLAYCGRVDPVLYGIKYHLPDEHAKAGLLAVSASLLQGLPCRVMEEGPYEQTPFGVRVRADALKFIADGRYHPLANKKPLAVLGGSIYLFDLNNM